MESEGAKHPEWRRKVRSIFSHCEKRHFTPAKAVSGIFGRYDYRILDNKTVNFFTIMVSVFFLGVLLVCNIMCVVCCVVHEVTVG